MKSSKACMSVTLVAALAVVLSGGACSGGKGDVGGGGDDGGAGTGQDATSSGGGGCGTDSDCAPQLPTTTPPNCAIGKCDALQGTCSFVAKDNDGDHDPTANCKANNGVPIQVGGDCNDSDPGIYSGHPETCTDLPDGGTAASPCSSGQKQCLPDGTESACTGTLVCVNQACVGGKCSGTCAAGQTQCSTDLTGVETCDTTGAYGAPVPCNNQTCSGPVGSASCHGTCTSGASGSCGVELGAKGACASGTTTCSNGAWGPCSVSPASADTCDPAPAPGSDANCNGIPNEGCQCINGNTEGCSTSGNDCPGTQSCGAGKWGTCSATGTCSCNAGPPAQTMSCQGTNGCAGTETCKTGNTWGLCVPNGSCQCAPNTNQPCTAADGCAGTQSCVVSGANQTWSTCIDAHASTFGQTCGTCGGTIQCDGSCSRGSTGETVDVTAQYTMDFNTTDCHANTATVLWTPNFPGPTNPSGTYTVSYTLTNHNNMSSSPTIVMYIGCSGSPTTGDGHSEQVMALGTVPGALTCPANQSVVYYPVLCGQSGSCCGDPSVQWNMTQWTSSNAYCVATP